MPAACCPDGPKAIVYTRPPWISGLSGSSQHGAGRQGVPCMDCTGPSFILGPVFPATQDLGPRGAVALQARAVSSGELQQSLDWSSFSPSLRTPLILSRVSCPCALGSASRHRKGYLFSQGTTVLNLKGPGICTWAWFSGMLMLQRIGKGRLGDVIPGALTEETEVIFFKEKIKLCLCLQTGTKTDPGRPC